MWAKDNITQYIDYCKGKYKEATVREYSKRIKILSEIEEEVGYPVLDCNREKLIRFIDFFKCSSKSAFYVVQGFLKSYFSYMDASKELFRYLREIKFDDIDSTLPFRLVYFKSLNSFIFLLEQRIESICQEEKVDISIFETVSCALFLGWYGATIEDILELKKNELKEDTNVIFLPHSKRTITIENRKVLELLYKYKHSTGVFRKGDSYEPRFYSYINSPYLFRSSRKERLSKNPLRASISQLLNRTDDDICFVYDKVRTSGILCRAHIKELERGSFEEIADIKRSDKSFVLNFYSEIFEEQLLNMRQVADKLVLYKRYKQVFYGE